MIEQIHREKADTPRDSALIVEPSRLMRDVIGKACRSRGLDAVEALEVGAALSHVSRRKPTFVLTAVELPGLCGFSLIAALRACPRHRAIPIGLLTTKPEMAGRMRDAQPDRVITKGAGLIADVHQFLAAYQG